MHFWVDALIMLYIFGFATARLGEWCLMYMYSTITILLRFDNDRKTTFYNNWHKNVYVTTANYTCARADAERPCPKHTRSICEVCPKFCSLSKNKLYKSVYDGRKQEEASCTVALSSQ